tara:strand:+ start:266 stop:889 length:624 start_codon:yes stop_codon:yes gene_type:complete
MSRLRAFLFLLLVTAAPAGAAAAANDGERAETFINRLSSQALEIVTNREMNREVRRKKFAELLNRDFDMAWIGQFVLGRNWNLATPEQRKEYLSLFANIIVYTYSKRFDDYNGQKIRVTGHQMGKRKYVFVKSQIFDPERSSSTINVIWRLLPRQGSYKIVDVVIEGISMGVTQRNEYNSVIQRAGGKIDALIDAMRQNLDKLRSNI